MKKKYYLRVLITTLVVILGISGIGWFTWHMGKLFVGLVATNSSDGKEKVEEKISKALSLPELSLWTCQVGVYKEKKNAGLLVESLKLKGWKAEIIKEEPYTVAIGAFHTKEKAIFYGNGLVEEGIEAWTREEKFPALHYKVSGKNAEKITALLENTNSLLKGMERNKVKDKLAGEMEILVTGECPTDFEKLRDALSTVLNTNYEEKEFTGLYNQDLLKLFLEYQLITTKYLTTNNT